VRCKPVGLAHKGPRGVCVLGEQKADVMVLDGEGGVGDAVLRAGEGRRLSETTEALLSAPIAMLAPTHGARFYDSDVRESGIRFDWQGGDRATLEIALDSGFSHGLRRVANATPGTVVRDLPPGNYYWRVRDREREDAWNETRRLIIHPTPGIEI